MKKTPQLLLWLLRSKLPFLLQNGSERVVGTVEIMIITVIVIIIIPILTSILIIIPIIDVITNIFKIVTAFWCNEYLTNASMRMRSVNQKISFSTKFWTI